MSVESSSYAQVTGTSEPAAAVGVPDRPQLIFATSVEGPALLDLLHAPGLLHMLARGGHALALALASLDETHVSAVRLLNQHAVPVVAWLRPPPDEGAAFHLQNYPQAMACYHRFHAWAREHKLHFVAVGLNIEPPLVEDAHDEAWGFRELARRLWLARENVLYPPAREAYIELITAMRHDGYEVHTYQTPFIADDRRAGTTLLQRALDIVDLPCDLEVLVCSSSLPVESLDNDLGGALIASYGPAADAIGISSASNDSFEDDAASMLPWTALRRDLLLAAQHTDTIYIFGLEDCVQRGMFDQIMALNWRASARAWAGRRALVTVLRGMLLALLLTIRFGRPALAWAGWGLAAALWVRQWRAKRRST